MTCVSSALSKLTLPMPSCPMATPMPRYRSRLGSPLRDEMRTAATATSRTSEQTSRSSLSVVDSQRPILPLRACVPDRASRRSRHTSLPYLIFDDSLDASRDGVRPGVERQSGDRSLVSLTDYRVRAASSPCAYGCSSTPRTTLPLEGQRCPPTQPPPPKPRRRGRRARLIVLVLVLALVAGVGYGAYWSVSTVRASFPQTTGSHRAHGLSGPVDVKRDGYGIPQIYADSDEDLFRAQGFVQAQDRFWEMDVRRHMTSGRLSEMFGPGQVETDAFLRTLGWRRVAQEEYDKQAVARDQEVPPGLRRRRQRLPDGAATARTLSLEYAALGLTNDYKPEQWTPVDSVAWLKAMAWDLRGNMQDEIDRVADDQQAQPGADRASCTRRTRTTGTSRSSRAAVDAATASSTRRPGSAPTTRTPASGGSTAERATAGGSSGGRQRHRQRLGRRYRPGAVRACRPSSPRLSDALEKVPALLGPNGNGIGSNSWVVSGKYTTTGKPLLANDPHLAPQLPSLWYQMGLHCRAVSAQCQYDVAGYTFSGMPGVIIGHNQDIAWGMTNLGADVTDLYLEKVSQAGWLSGTPRGM